MVIFKINRGSTYQWLPPTRPRFLLSGDWSKLELWHTWTLKKALLVQSWSRRRLTLVNISYWHPRTFQRLTAGLSSSRLRRRWSLYEPRAYSIVQLIGEPSNPQVTWAMCDWVFLNGHVAPGLGQRPKKIDLNQNIEIPRVRAVRNRADKAFSKILETPRKKRQVSESAADDGNQGKILKGLSEPCLAAPSARLKAALPFPRPRTKTRLQVRHTMT